MEIEKLIMDIQEIGFDTGLVAENKYIVGKKEIDTTFPIEYFSSAFWVIIEDNNYKVEYYKGQIFIEQYFPDIDSTLFFIKENLLPGIDRMR